ncbi:thioesterase domain-containing protein [Variovorax sp. LARHSF232]
MARHLPQLTLHGLQMDLKQSSSAQDFDTLVEGYLQRMLALQAHGPYHLLGWSLGGNVAQALAARLRARGEAVALLALMDSYPAEAWTAQPQPVYDDALRTLLGVNGDFDTADIGTGALLARLQRAGSPFAGLGADGLERWARESLRQMQLFRRSATQPFDGPMVFYRALRNPPHRPGPEVWAPHVHPALTACVALDCSHDGLSDPLPMAQIGADLARRFEALKR